MIVAAFWCNPSLPISVRVIPGWLSYASEVGEHGANGWIIYCGY